MAILSDPRLRIREDTIRKGNLLNAIHYVHATSLKPAFVEVAFKPDEGQGNANAACNALDYAQRSLSDFVQLAGSRDYFITIAWGDREANKMLDVFGYSGMRGWPGNPDVESWVLKNGILTRDKQMTCGDSLILLGAEERLRRECASLDEYMQDSGAKHYELRNRFFPKELFVDSQLGAK